MKRVPIFVLHLLLIFSFMSCSDVTLDDTKKNTLYNVSYGPYIRNRMDVVLPAHRSYDETPVVIFIHGGAWIMGDKSTFLTEINQMADAGIASVSINYRFVSDLAGVHHPTCPNDVRLAVDFIVSKASEWQINPNRIGIVGHSAGGHLALLTAYQYNSDNRIKACASWAGPVDFTDPHQLAITGAHELFRTYMGFPLSSAADSSKYRSASPFWNINNNSVPTLLIYGTEDIGVPYSNAIKTTNRLDQFNVVNKKVELTGSGHIWVGNDLTLARQETLSWFLAHL